jgi:hypothetical protein
MHYLLFWPSWFQVTFVVTVFSSVSILGLYIVRVSVPVERLKQNHEVAGFTFGVIGAFYGHLLAFVIVAAWERFDRADEMVQGESIGLTSLYRLSKSFPQPVQHNLQQAIRDYTNHAINVEWPQMAANYYGKADNPTGALGMWAIFQLRSVGFAVILGGGQELRSAPVGNPGSSAPLPVWQRGIPVRRMAGDLRRTHHHYRL